jgi:hypothetical protein
LAVVADTSFTLLEMLDLVAAHVLEVCKKTLLYLAVVYLAYEGT